ncbi:hypothetical protein AMQ84_26455 [Paenibacillus riograndensis]|uniref:Aminoglycoside phosphotransferase domain-containing protein n=1 Tax=Paenibacillus riograndensis TaxID=483937 RepID=A0A132TM25_9BACL|nr:phosphotransferase [Paenibacillus riograndensis]KWX72223.1 hypothetical protein AMQ84_26455 [Paenibacillus riograndensis]
MTDTCYQLDFAKLCLKYNLGQPTREPEQIFGGFLHRMYRLETDLAEYAVKALNPEIMQRSTAMDNYILSEKAANLARRNGINALPAIVSKGSFMHEVNGQYYLLFPWVEGTPLVQGVIDLEYCQIIGQNLARIHGTDFSALLDGDVREEVWHPKAEDWAGYADQAAQQDMEWSSLLLRNLDNLRAWENRVNTSFKLLLNNRVISHRDLDPKNVLWDDNRVPVFIDWEAAGLINPVQELLEVAMYWSSSDTGLPDKEAFLALIAAYLHQGGTILNRWLDALNAGFQGKLEWLAYSIRRSLRLEYTDEHDQEIGTREVTSTLQSLQNYAESIPVVLEWLEGAT